MSQDTFRALVLTQENGAIRAEFRQLTNDDLPQGDTLVQVVYSCLNYKDGLNVTGKGKISRFSQWFLASIWPEPSSKRPARTTIPAIR